MAPQDPPNEITLRVKVPPGHIAGTSDDELSLGSISTSLPITALRQRIQTLIPGNPTPVQQRILYGGRALVDDAQSIADALNTRRDTGQTEYVVHLLVKGGAGNQGRADNGGVHHRTASSAQTPIQPQPQPLPPHVAQQHAVPPPGAIQLPQLGAIPGIPGMMGFPGLVGHHLQPQPQPQPGQFPVPHHNADPQLQQPGDTNAAQQHQPANEQPQQHQPQPQPQNHPHLHQYHNVNPQSRPISGQGFHLSGTAANGQRFAIHQQTLNFPAVALPGAQLPFGMPAPHQPHPGLPQMPGMGLPFPLPGMAQQPPQPGQAPVVTALDRARENMVEMRRMLETMRNESSNSEETRSRVVELERRIQSINDYIDPFNLGGRANPILPVRSASQPPDTQAGHVHNPPEVATGTRIPAPQPLPPPQIRPSPGAFGLMHPAMLHQQQLRPRHSPPAEVTAYLLSSPRGPQALLFTPQHGRFSGHLATQQSATHHVNTISGNEHVPTPTQPPAGGQPNPDGGQLQDPAAAQVPQPDAVQGQLAAQQADALAPLQQILGHFWLLFRIMIAAYVFLGSSMGWRRPAALALIGLGFWMIRLGLFGNGGVIRRWWDGVVRIEDIRERLRRQGLPVDGDQEPNRPGNEGEANDGNVAQQPGEPNGQAAEQAATHQADQQAPAQGIQRRNTPTPEELAQRLIQEREQNLQRAPLHRLREQIRPVERAAALFVASLWPGVGERYVQQLDNNRQAEDLLRRELERRRDEAEAERREREAIQADDKKEVPASETETAAEKRAEAEGTAVLPAASGSDSTS